MRRRLLILALVIGLSLLGLPAQQSTVWADPGPVAGSDPALLDAGWPLRGNPEIAEEYNPPEERWKAGHRGIDLAATVGADVLAAAGGTVTFAGTIAGKGVVVVAHGALRTTYQPVVAAVAVGTIVARGALLGRLTTGGHCAMACLHWGLKRGDNYLDPRSLLRRVARDDPPEIDETPGDLRLLGAEERASARRAAAERAEARRLAALAGVISGPGFTGTAATGRHEFRFPVAARLTSPYGMRFHPIRKIWKLHDGTDFGAGCGTPIVAPAAGVVSRQSSDGAYGNRLMIDHGVVDGRRVVTGFNHATSYAVGVGTTVKAGQVIGYVGSTGYSTGCHLHLMVWLNGSLVNPMSWFG